VGGGARPNQKREKRRRELTQPKLAEGRKEEGDSHAGACEGLLTLLLPLAEKLQVYGKNTEERRREEREKSTTEASETSEVCPSYYLSAAVC